jgi:hypothetical protein
VDAAKAGLMHIATTMKANLGGRQIVPQVTVSARVDRSLVKAIARAHDLRHRLERKDDIGLHGLAREDGCSRPYVSTMIRLAYLAPTITQAILDGTQPSHLTLADLMQRDISAGCLAGPRPWRSTAALRRTSLWVMGSHMEFSCICSST